MTASTGITMVEAIHQKYDDDVETCIHIHIPASAPGKTGKHYCHDGMHVQYTYTHTSFSAWENRYMS